MTQQTILVEFYYLRDETTILSCDGDYRIKRECFVVSKFNTEEEALKAYENSIAAWSVILDNDEDVYKFINEAYKHIKGNSLDDYHWLCEHFL